MPLKDELTLPTKLDAIAVRPESLPVPTGKTERRELRTPTGKTFVHPQIIDGKETRTCVSQIGAVCYRDDDGQLRSIDTTIRDLGTHVGVEWAPYKFRLHKTGIGFDFESREGGQCTVSLTGIGGEKFEDSIKPEVSENVITYRDVRPGCDIVFKCLNERVKTLRILRDDKAPRTFDWTVTSDKPELIDSTLRGTDATGNELELSSELDGDVIRETWTGKTKIILDPATRIKSLSDEVSYPVEIDPTVSYTTVGANDGHEKAGTTWYANNTTMPLGRYGGIGTFSPGMMWTGVAVPQGSTITSATLSVYVNSVFNAGGAGKLYGRLATNPGAFDSTDRPSTVSKTTANTVTARETSTGSKSYDATAIVQEIVNQGGFASGNNVAISFLTTETVGNNYHQLRAYEHAGGAGTAPSISVTYTAAAGGTSNNLLLLGCG